MPTQLRSVLAFFLAALLVGGPSFAFQSPLSEESIREAYFLGQRGDETMARRLAQYTKALPAPDSGPHIAAISFFTPFALAVQSSSQHASGYSAQQAQIDHRSQAEFVRVVVEIRLTRSYGALIAAPTGSRSGSPTGYVFRPYDFWKDFDVSVVSPGLPHDSPSNSEPGQARSGPLRPFSSHGQPDLLCDEGGCILTGATLYFDFLATAFGSGDAIIEVIPPEGDAVSLDFDLSSLR
jgi:hypothetical protein